VTVPGNTRFFIVLQQGAAAGRGHCCRRKQGPGNTAVASTGEQPELLTAAEFGSWCR
jgi:hypothetical protein